MTDDVVRSDQMALNVIVRGGFTYTALGLIQVSEDVSFADWQAEVYHVDDARRAMKFWLGDLLNYGEGRYGAMAEQVADARRFVYEDLDTLKWVCHHVPVSLRSEKLSFSHHRAVAKLEPDDIAHLLRQAEEQELSVHDLKCLADALKPPRRAYAQLPAQVPAAVLPGNNARQSDTESEALAGMFARHDRNRIAQQAEDEDVPPESGAPSLADGNMRDLGEAVVNNEYGRHIGLLFNTAPDLHEGQRVRVWVEVIHDTTRRAARAKA